MLIAVQSGDRLNMTALPPAVGGAQWVTDAAGTRLLYAEGRDGLWRIEPARGMQVRGSQAAAAAINLSPDAQAVLNIDALDGTRSWCVSFYPEDDGTLTCTTYGFPGDAQITVGRARDNTLVFDNSFVSAHHLGLSYEGKRWTVVDFGSSNGVFVNGWRIPANVPRALQFGDVVTVLGLHITLGAGFISCNNPGGALSVPADFVRYRAPHVVATPDADPVERPLFYPSLRFMRTIEPKSFTIDPPPAKDREKPAPLLLRVAPSLIMGIAAIVSAVVLITMLMGEGATPLRAVPLGVMAVAMLAGSVLVPILSERHRQKERERLEAVRKGMYSQYISSVLYEMAVEEDVQRSILEENRIPVMACMGMAASADPHLMDRTSLHSDFLDVRIGIGDEPFLADIRYPEQHFTVEEDELRELVEARSREVRVLHNVPLAVPLIDKHVLGVVGQAPVAAAFVRGIVVQVAALCSYGDVKVVVLCDEANRAEWEFASHLPHCFSDDKSVRLFACGLEEASELGMHLEHVIEERRQQQLDPREARPYYVVVCASEQAAAKAGIVQALVDTRVNRGLTLIALAQNMRELPKECRSVINLDPSGAYQLDRDDPSGARKPFAPDIFVTADQASTFAFHLSKVRLDLYGGKRQMPTRLGFLEMFGAGNVDHLNIASRWRESNPAASLACRVGVDSQGEAFLLNLHEKFHGPHGLVAGTTGSGKSEFLVTYILSMAITYSPADVAFVLIDYKGGGLARTFDNEHVRLPHLAGTVTNLDGTAIARSLASIRAELKRRQALFNSARDAVGGETVDIYEYQNLYRQGRMTEPCPHLFIIADEFAELKQNQPEFMDELISAARIGRSLGVHLVLATQKPSGVVNDQIWSNARFKVCLKVADAADSREMIKRPDAAELQDPGRFYLLVGYNAYFALGQAAYAGTRYAAQDRFTATRDDSVVLVSDTGRSLVSMKPRRVDTQGEEGPESVAVIAAIQEVAARSGISARRLWLEPVPDLVCVDDLALKYGRPFSEPTHSYTLNPIAGEFDDPARQRQGLLSVPLTEKGNALVYGTPDSGVEAFLSSVVYSLVRDHDAESLNIYALDFGSESLRAFAGAPQVGDVAGVADEEKLVRFFDFFDAEFARRRTLLAPYGGSFERYVAQGGSLPSIVVVLNDLAAIIEAYPALEERLAKFLRETGRAGVYVVATAAGATSVRVRMRQCFRQVFACNLPDYDAYAAVLSSMRGVVLPRGFARGLVQTDDGIFEFQAARLVSDGSDFEYALQTCGRAAQLASAMGEAFAPEIPVSPDQVTVDDLQHLDASATFLPFGFYDSDLSPAGFDFAESPLARVQFQRRKDGVAFARAFMDYAASCKGWNVALLDTAKMFGGLAPHGCSFATTSAARACVYLQSCGADRKGADAGSLLVAITGVAGLIGGLDADSAAGVRSMLRGLTAGGGVYVMLVDSTAEGAYTFEDWYKAHLTNKDGLWIGPGIDSQSVLPVNYAPRLAADRSYEVAAGAPREVHAVSSTANSPVPFKDDSDSAGPDQPAVQPQVAPLPGSFSVTPLPPIEPPSDSGFYFVMDD